MKAPRANVYGRADQAAVWMLLSRLYLNAEVYTGTPQWSAAAEYSKKVMDAGFSLAPNYGDNFLADNNTSPEINQCVHVTTDKAGDKEQSGPRAGLYAIITNRQDHLGRGEKVRF